MYGFSKTEYLDPYIDKPNVRENSLLVASLLLASHADVLRLVRGEERVTSLGRSAWEAMP